jgi:beta-glucanase (GH16 family)
LAILKKDYKNKSKRKFYLRIPNRFRIIHFKFALRMYKTKFSNQFLACAFSICLFNFVACSKGSDKGPELKIVDASVARSTTESVMKFGLILSKPSSGPVSVDYTLSNGTATSPGDYIQAAGTVTIPANQPQGTIDVVIPGNANDVRQDNLQFTITLSNPKACILTVSKATGTIITENGTYLTTDNTGYSTPLTYPGYTLVWSDEFSGNSLDLNSWNQEVGNGSGGWGNNELESYTNSTRNTFVSNGNLIIEARRETLGSYNYSSGRMTTQDKKSFKFGRIDIRAKLPVGQGIWPALWMLGSNITNAGWPKCGEIDIMELIGTTPSTVYGTLHWANSNGAHASKGSSIVLPSGDYSKQFHVFTLTWAEDNLQWYVDDKKFLDISISDLQGAPYPFNLNQFFIFNVAVGGNWPGSPDGNTKFPQRMFVDYVRVFQ